MIDTSGKESGMKTHLPCPDCGHNDCRTEFDDGGYYCHSCGASSKQKQMPVPDLKFEHRGYRGIKCEVAKRLNILTGLDANGVEISRVYPYPHRPKVRILPKDFSRNTGFTNDYLLGLDMFNAGSSRKITIVEGEDDWASTYQMLGESWPVFALPGARTVSKILKNPKCYNALKAFDSIILATDSDEAGQRSAEQIARAFPNKCYIVNMSKHKDPNEYLVNGDSSEFFYAWVNARKYVPDNIFNTTEQFTKIIRDDVGAMYVPTGIEDFDSKALGLFQGYWTLFQAPEGRGKTEFMHMLEWGLISNHPTISIAVMHLEETKKRTLLALASYSLGKNVTLQDTETVFRDNGDEEIVYLPSYNGVPEEEVLSAISSFTNRENFYQFTLGVDDDPAAILEQVRYFSEVCGVKYVFFEPIQDLAYSRQDDSTLEGWLSQISTKMARLCSELGVGVITVAHENDDGQIRDCRMIGKRAGVVVRLERDLQASDEDLRNQTILTVLKNRPVGNTGYAGTLQFNPDSFTLEEKTY